MSQCRTLAEYVTNTQYNNLPPEVIQESKKILLDTLGAIIRAWSRRYSAGTILADFVGQLGGKKESSLIGRGMKTSSVNAVLANGTMGYYCDVESYHPESLAHAASVIVPTVLAVGESRRSSGRDLLPALVAGYEIETRVSMALDPSALYKRGFHPSGIAGTFGATAAAGKLLALNVEEQVNAFGLAGCQTSGLLAWCTDQTENSRPFQMGVAARNGVTSALLAKKGFGAPPDIFSGKNGMFGAFTDDPKPQRLIEELENKFTIKETAYKLYSCCAFLHPGADALLSLISKNNLTPADIEEIHLHYPKPGAQIIDNNELKSHTTQYILPVLAVRGEVTIDDILHERREDPEINRLSKNTHLIYDEELGPLFPKRYTSIVVLKTKGGKELTERVDFARGTAENPITMTELEAKFRKITTRELPKKKIEECIKSVNQIEGARNISGLISLTHR